MNVHELARRYIDCKTVHFFLKSLAQDSDARKARELHMRTPIGRACEARERERERKKNDCIFSVSPKSRSLFSTSFQTLCFTARTYLNTQKYGLSCSLARL